MFRQVSTTLQHCKQGISGCITIIKCMTTKEPNFQPLFIFTLFLTNVNWMFDLINILFIVLLRWQNQTLKRTWQRTLLRRTALSLLNSDNYRYDIPRFSSLPNVSSQRWSECSVSHIRLQFFEWLRHKMIHGNPESCFLPRSKDFNYFAKINLLRA